MEQVTAEQPTQSAEAVVEWLDSTLADTWDKAPEHYWLSQARLHLLSRASSPAPSGLVEAAKQVLRYYDTDSEAVSRGVINELRAALQSTAPAPAQDRTGCEVPFCAVYGCQGAPHCKMLTPSGTAEGEKA